MELNILGSCVGITANRVHLMSKEVTCRVLAPVIKAIHRKYITENIWFRDISYNQAYISNIRQYHYWQNDSRLIQNICPYYIEHEIACTLYLKTQLIFHETFHANLV